MKKYKVVKELPTGEIYVDIYDDFIKKMEVIEREVVIIVDVDEFRPMAWVRATDMINAIVYLDSNSYNYIAGKGSEKYRDEIEEVLIEIGFRKRREENVIFTIGEEEMLLFDASEEVDDKE